MPDEKYGEGPRGRDGDSPGARGAGPAERIELVVERMARREGGGHLLVPPSLPMPPGDATPPVGVRRVRCPWCGAEGGDAALPDGLPRVTMLACESLTNRSLLPVVTARRPPEEGYLTRAAYWAGHAPVELDDAALIRLIIAVDAAESWADVADDPRAHPRWSPPPPGSGNAGRALPHPARRGRARHRERGASAGHATRRRRVLGRGDAAGAARREIPSRPPPDGGGGLSGIALSPPVRGLWFGSRFGNMHSRFSPERSNACLSTTASPR